MRADWDSRTRSIERIREAMLQGAIEHVDQSGLGVGRFGLPCHDIEHPSHSHGIQAHIDLANDVLVAGNTHPLVRAPTQYGHLALSIHLGNRGL